MDDKEKKAQEFQAALDNHIKQANIQPVFADGVSTRLRVKVKMASEQGMSIGSNPEKTILFEIIFFDTMTKMVAARMVIDRLTVNDLIIQIQQASEQIDKMQLQ